MPEVYQNTITLSIVENNEVNNSENININMKKCEIKIENICKRKVSLIGREI
jgi:hypothetical protein